MASGSGAVKRPGKSSQIIPFTLTEGVKKGEQDQQWSYSPINKDGEESRKILSGSGGGSGCDGAMGDSTAASNTVWNGGGTDT
jgi:hypothetical protein